MWSPGPSGGFGFGRLLRAEWTKLRSVRSTPWSLGILVVAAIGLNTLVVALTMSSWHDQSAGSRQDMMANPTGFLGAALNFAQIPLCVLGVLVITSEYSTGMIRASVLAVPRRTPMLLAKVAVFGVVAFVVGEILAFPTFFIAQAIIHKHIPVSLGDPGVFRAVFGVGLYLAVLGLFALAVGALVRNTGAAITAVVGFVLVLSNLAGLLPGSLGAHVNAYLPANAGKLIMSAHQQSSDLLSPWQGFAIFCAWTILLLGAAALLLNRRDV